MSSAAAPLYRRLWRWHFYAAFLVIPFVLLQSLTGTLYLWHQEWADAAHPELRFVQPRTQRASLDTQLAAAQALHPHAQPSALIVPADPRRSTQVMFGGGHHGAAEPACAGSPSRSAATPAPPCMATRAPAQATALPFPVFVDPYDARVLGELPGWRWMPGWSRRVHGGWPLGEAGSWLLELGACWAVVMVLSGLYLWWPRDRGVLAALVPRTGQGLRVLLRDLHGSVAVLCSGLLLLFLVSALPWTSFWGQKVLQPLQNAIGQPSPFGATARARSTPGAGSITLDQALAAARAAGVDGEVEIKLDGKAGSALTLRNRHPRAAQETQVALDRTDGALLVKTTWADYPAIPRAVATGVDLHEGSYFGRTNQWVNSLLAFALLWISVTGFLSWWLRRPRGQLGAPRRLAGPLPRTLRIGALALCLALPLLGLSVLCLWLLDALLLRLRAPLASARG